MNEEKRKKVEKEILDWFEEYKEAVERYNELKKKKPLIDQKIEKIMDEKGEGEYSIKSKNLNAKVICRRVLKKKVVFDADKLEGKISDKSILKEIINKTYVVSDWKGFAKYMKLKGIKAKDIIKFIDVQKEVDNDQIDQLEEIGLITYDDVKGCFYCTDISSYIRYTIKR